MWAIDVCLNCEDFNQSHQLFFGTQYNLILNKIQYLIDTI